MRFNSSQFRNIIFGSEDSLVSTLGVLFGVASANVEKQTIILTGLIVIAVEALSMGAGSFLSETSANEYDESSTDNSNPVTDGVLMFISYFVSGFIPLFPYVVFEVHVAMVVSIMSSLATLFILGFIPKKSLTGGFRMATIAGIAILIGFVIAKVFGTHTA